MSGWSIAKWSAIAVSWSLFVFFAVEQLFSKGVRPRLTLNDWDPKWGWLGTLALLDAGLLYGGGAVLFGRNQHFRLGGALALLAGLALLMLIVRYLRRPAAGSARAAKLGIGTAAGGQVGIDEPPFPTNARGYDKLAVDIFFGRIAGCSPVEIEQARFPTRFGGYDEDAVDAAMEHWKLKHMQSDSATQGDVRA